MSFSLSGSTHLSISRLKPSPPLPALRAFLPLDEVWRSTGHAHTRERMRGGDQKPRLGLGLGAERR